MDSATKTVSRLTRFLAVLCALCALTALVMTLACLPHLLAQETVPAPAPTPETASTEAPTAQAPTEEMTEATLPPPEPNPFGTNDFQYDRRNFLHCTAARTVAGIDVSSYQGEPDWQKVADYGVEFAMIRVGLRGYGTGKLKEDPTAHYNLEGATKAGIAVGVYIFSQATNTEEAAEEAAFLLDIIKDYEITMPVVFDWEQVSADDARTANMDKETLTACTLEFCRIVEEAGYQPMIYFNRHQATELLELAELTDYPFWLAAYNDRMYFPSRFQMWQYTDSGRIPGIEGKVDLDMWFIEE